MAGKEGSNGSGNDDGGEVHVFPTSPDAENASSSPSTFTPAPHMGRRLAPDVFGARAVEQIAKLETFLRGPNVTDEQRRTIQRWIEEGTDDPPTATENFPQFVYDDPSNGRYAWTINRLQISGSITGSSYPADRPGASISWRLDPSGRLHRGTQWLRIHGARFDSAQVGPGQAGQVAKNSETAEIGRRLGLKLVSPETETETNQDDPNTAEVVDLDTKRRSPSSFLFEVRSTLDDTRDHPGPGWFPFGVVQDPDPEIGAVIYWRRIRPS